MDVDVRCAVRIYFVDVRLADLGIVLKKKPISAILGDFGKVVIVWFNGGDLAFH